MRFRLISTFATLVAAFILVAAASAFAQSTPTTDVYAPPSSGEVKDVVAGGSPTDVIPPPAEVEAVTKAKVPTAPKLAPPVRVVEHGAAPSSGSLPFTGFEAGLVALAGLALLGTGFALRRVARTPA